MVGHRAAGPRHGAPVPPHRGHARGRRARREDRPRDADGARLRRRDLHPPGGRRDAPRARTSRRACRGRRGRRRGTSGRSSSSRTWTGSRPSCRSRSSTTRRWRTIGIKRVVNGPFTFSPDGNPLVGPIRGLRGYWVACGVMAGLSQGGGVGLALATWMTAGDHGDSGMDIWAMDVARYGDYANARLHERQGPGELPAPLPDHVPERGAAGRPAAADDADLRPADRGERRLGRDVRAGARAVVPGGRPASPKEEVTFRRSNAWDQVAAEVAAVRERVGMTEISNYAKYRVTGTGRRGLAVVAAHGADAGARPDHADRDAQRGGPDRRRVHGRAGDRRRRVLPVRVAAGRGPSLALVPPPPAGRRIRPVRGARAGPDRAVASPGRDRATCSRRSRRTSTCRPRRSRS